MNLQSFPLGDFYMAKIGCFYGTTSGNTEIAAELIEKNFNDFQEGIIDLHDIATVELDEANNYDILLIGVPTWNVGELQADWDELISEVKDLKLEGKKVAFFGMGDQGGYPETYQDAMGILSQEFRQYGAELVGRWSTEGYEFDESQAVEDDQFIGLALDEENQSELSEERVEKWVGQLIEELELSA